MAGSSIFRCKGTYAMRGFTRDMLGDCTFILNNNKDI